MFQPRNISSPSDLDSNVEEEDLHPNLPTLVELNLVENVLPNTALEAFRGARKLWWDACWDTLPVQRFLEHRAKANQGKRANRDKAELKVAGKCLKTAIFAFIEYEWLFHWLGTIQSPNPLNGEDSYQQRLALVTGITANLLCVLGEEAK